MALTGGLLTFLGVEALFEAFELQAARARRRSAARASCCSGSPGSFLTMTFISGRFSGKAGGAIGGVALATLVAIGIGLHNFGEGLAIGTSFAFGQLTLGSFLIVGFMVHNITEGLGIAAPAADEGATLSWPRLVALTLIAGAPAILGAWLGGFAANDVLAALFFGAAAGAAFEVVAEVVRYVARRAPGGLRSGYALGGFLAGIAIMYVDRPARRVTVAAAVGALARARSFARPGRPVDRPLACGCARGRGEPRRPRCDGGRPGRALRAHRQRRAARRPDPQRRRRADRRPARDRVHPALGTRRADGRARRRARDLRLRRASPSGSRSSGWCIRDELSYLWVVAAAGALGFVGNEIAAQVRLRAGRRLSSPALIADGNHARVDGFVSLGVVASAIVVALGLERADPLIGLGITLVILKITWSSWRTVRAR